MYVNLNFEVRGRLQAVLQDALADLLDERMFFGVLRWPDLVGIVEEGILVIELRCLN